MKLRYLLCFILLLPFNLFAGCWSMEIGGAVYQPPKILRHTYSGAWIDYQLEASRMISDHVEVWAGVNWISKKEHEDESYGSDHDKKQIWILPVSLGAKYFYYVTPCLSLYLGGGAAYTFLRMEHHSDSFNHAHSKHGLGAVIKSGVRYDWGDYTFINLFVDYFSQTFFLNRSHREELGINRRTLDLSGFKIGFGIGVYF